MTQTEGHDVSFDPFRQDPREDVSGHIFGQANLIDPCKVWVP